MNNKLRKVLDNHRLWIKSEGEQGRKASLCEETLTGVDLRGQDLRFADLRGINLEDADLRNINLKDLRALNESILVNKGLDVVSVAKRLGHLPSTSVNYYLDEIPEEDKKASEILDNLF